MSTRRYIILREAATPQTVAVKSTAPSVLWFADLRSVWSYLYTSKMVQRIPRTVDYPRHDNDIYAGEYEAARVCGENGLVLSRAII